MSRPLSYLNDAYRCPDCDSPSFIFGPAGGSAVNIKCAECGSTFWFAPPFTPERIADAGAWAYTRAAVNLADEMQVVNALSERRWTMVPPQRRSPDPFLLALVLGGLLLVVVLIVVLGIILFHRG